MQLAVDDVQPFDRRQLVLQPGKAEVGARSDERIDLRRREMLEQARHVVVDAVAGEPFLRDERVEVGEAADVDRDLHPLVERRQPPGHRAAHRHAERADARGIDVRPRDQPVHRPQAVVDHHAPQHLTFPQHRLEHVGLGRVAALAEHPVIDGQRRRIRGRSATFA